MGKKKKRERIDIENDINFIEPEEEEEKIVRPKWLMPTVVIMMILLSFYIGRGLSIFSSAKNDASDNITQANKVAEQTGLVNKTAKDTEQQLETSSKTEKVENGMLYTTGYDEELTENIDLLLNEDVYPQCSGTIYDEELIEACKNGSIETYGMEVAKNHQPSGTAKFISCQLQGEYDYETVYAGVSNGAMYHSDTTSYWVGAVNRTDGYTIYILLIS